MESVSVTISLTKDFSSLASALSEIYEMQETLKDIDYAASFEFENSSESRHG